MKTLHQALAMVSGLVALVFPATPAHARLQQQAPGLYDDSVEMGDLPRYEAMYGTPTFLEIDDEMSRPWPRKTSISTVGDFVEIPGRGGGVSGAGYLGHGIDYLNPASSHMLCGERHCVALVPMEEISNLFADAALTWLRQRVEVTGAIEDLNKNSPGANPLWVFQVWSISLRPDSPERQRGPTRSELESVVTSPEALDGKTIVATGVFRGANLFEDMPPETRRDGDDWVLKDGPFFVWVTGKEPKGSGFSLDTQSRSDCRWRLEVTGKVETRGDVIYLKARKVRLLGLASDEEGSN